MRKELVKFVEEKPVEQDSLDYATGLTQIADC